MATDYTSRDFDSLKQEMISRLTVLLPELNNKKDSEFAIAMIELFAWVGDLLSYTLDRYSNEVYLESAIQKENVIKICNMLGYKLRNWQPAKVTLTFSITAPVNKMIIIPARTVCLTEGSNPIRFETDEIAIIEVGQTSVTVTATQGETKEETLGYSNGSSNQIYNLTYQQVLDGVKIYVEGEEYDEIDNFINSSSEGKDFVVERYGSKSSRVLFGNGVNGYIPENDYRIFASYRIGGGEIGNVSMNSITVIKGQIYNEDNIIADVYVTNQEDAYDGEDEESIASAKAKAPSQIYTLWRAVTKDDFIKLALTLPDVEKATATVDSAGGALVNMYIKLKNSETISAERLGEIYAFFVERKLIGARVSINPPIYRTNTVNITAYTFPGLSNSEIRLKIIDFVQNQYKVGTLGFGEELYSGEIIQSLMEWVDVKNVDVDIAGGVPAENEMVKIVAINVTVTGGK